MKKLIILILSLATSLSVFSDVKVLSVKGDVKIRQGISEEWKDFKSGDLLSLEDAIKVGNKSAAVVLIGENKKITLPEMSIVEISDLRFLSKEELLLKLAMERILSVPTQDRKNDLVPAHTSVIHGEKREDSENLKPINLQNAEMLLNGAKLLYSNDYFGTFIIRIKEVLRIYPDIENDIEYRVLAAQALENTNLYREAINEYNSILSENISGDKRQTIMQSIERLNKKIKD